ncbi:MAG: CdaR family protein [Clostridiaceae bacterium]|nr:CdaR family protein [Clostridiaceae bacterium]
MIEWMRKNDIASKALSVGFALFLWFYVVSTTNPDMTQTFTKVAVDFTGTEALSENDLIITEGRHSTVSFKVSGKSERIAMLDSDRLSVSADLSNITSPGNYNLKYQVTTSVTDVTINKITETIPIYVDRIISKSVPVKVTFSGTLADGYISDNYSVTPDAITVKGPEQLLDTIVSAAATYDISALKSSADTTLIYTLVNSKGEEVKSPYITVDAPSIKLSLAVSQTGNIPFVLTVNDFGFITKDLVKITIEPSSIKISGSPDVVSMLNQIDLGSISLETIFESGLFELELPVILPNGVTSDDNITSVKVAVEPVGITKTSLEITKDMMPESSYFRYVSNLSVTVWTTEDHASSISADNIDVSLSYYPENLHEGLNEISATVTSLDDKMVIVGEYSVIVEVPK